MLVAQLIEDQAEGRNFGRGIEPGQGRSRSQARGGDHVIELGGRRNVHIQFARAVDEHRITLNALGAQHGGKERVLVFAVAIAVLENVGGGVRLIAPDS